MIVYHTLVMGLCFLLHPCVLSYAQSKNIYELRSLSPDDWLELSPVERMNALNTSINQSRNQTFLGQFNRELDRYRSWGYDYYDMNDGYENYAFRGFTDYRILDNRRMKWTYTEFGERIVKMSVAANIWHETVGDDGTSDITGPGNYINYLSGVNLQTEGIWVVRESTEDWAAALIGGEKVRTIFTPLTLSHPALRGMRVDLQTSNYRASMVNAFGSSNSWSDTADNIRMIRGFHARRRFGVLSVGSTFVTTYLHQKTREKGDSWKGTLQDNVPTPMIYLVRVIDDSPWDGSGPIVHNVRLRVNGVYRDDILPEVILDDLKQETISAVYPFKGSSNPYRPHYLTDVDRSNRNFIEHDIYTVTNDTADPSAFYINKPKYVDYFFLNDLRQGWNTNNLTHYCNIDWLTEYHSVIDPAGMPLRVNGTRYVIYWFDLSSITDPVNRVQAEMTVSNDYRIQTSVIYTEQPSGGHDSKGDYQSYYAVKQWTTMAVADGNVKDGSNIRTVSIDFAYPVGNTVYGVDADFDWYGCRIRGEYVTNTHYSMYPDGVPGSGVAMIKISDWRPRTGHRSSITDHAWYITAQKDWRHVGLSGEYFRMGKFYKPFAEGLGSLIADNDDYDQFVDNENDEDGIFPGLDKDNDGIPDTERNLNGIPDYFEPFLMFDVDPESFALGDDFDDNTIPDYLEDDRYADTPYDLDRKGYHVSVRFTPVEHANFIAGSLRTRGVGVDNRTFNDYAKFRVDYSVFTVGKISAELRHERIQDNIHDPFSVYDQERTASSYASNLGGLNIRKNTCFDKLEYRNSDVNKLFLESKIRAVPSITVEQFFKYERNSQFGGVMYDNTFQLPGILTTVALSQKAAFTKQWGNWTATAGLKIRSYKYDRSYHMNPEDYFTLMIPLTYVKYRFSPATEITFGAQGFKNAELRYLDFLDKRNDFRQTNYVLQVANKSNYFGFDVWGLWGFRLEQIMYDDPGRTWEDYKWSSFFVKVYTGY